MKTANYLTTCLLATLLSACDSSNNTTSPSKKQTSQQLDLSDSPQHTLTEGYPLAKYVSYDNNEASITNIESISLDMPFINVLEPGRLGQINTKVEGMEYSARQVQPSELLYAKDQVKLEDNFWYVKDDNKVYFYDAELNQEVAWQLEPSARYTELAVSDDNQSAWLFDQQNNQLQRFSLAAPNKSATDKSLFKLPANSDIQGLHLEQEELYLLDSQVHQTSSIFHFSYQQHQLSLQDAWLLSGFDDYQINDLVFLSDQRFLISLATDYKNIILVDNKESKLGDGPIEQNGELEKTAEFDFPDSIKQPSGINKLGQDWLVLTDQAEVFLLNPQMAIKAKLDIEYKTIGCNQGCTEAIAVVDNGFYVVSDRSVLAHYQVNDNEFEYLDEYKLDFAASEGIDFAGIGYDANSQLFYLVSDGEHGEQADELFILDASLNLLERKTISYPQQTEQSIFSYDAKGAYFYQDHLYVISEQFTKLLQLSSQGEIQAVYDLLPEDIDTPSDLYIDHNGIYIIGDHEDADPVPALTQFELDKDN